jgi:ABC-type tungstate transport system substrate-binding protein
MGEFQFALVLGALLLSLAFLVNILLLRLQHRIPYWPGR